MKKRKKYIYTGEDAWTNAEISLLKKMYPVNDNNVISEKLNRSVRSIRAKAFILLLKKSNRYWSPSQEKLLLKNWKSMTAKEIGELLLKTRWAVINKYREIQRKQIKGSDAI